MKPPRKIEYGRLSETDSNKSNTKNDYESKTTSLKRQQSPVSSPRSKNFADIKTELQMALNSTKNKPKAFGTIKKDTANIITKIYFSNKPDYYRLTPDSPSSSDSIKRFNGNPSCGRKITFMRSSPGVSQQSREGSISSCSNSISTPKPSEIAYQSITRSRTTTPPKYLNLNSPSSAKLIYSKNSNVSPTKPNLPSSSVLYHQTQTHGDWNKNNIKSGRNSSSGSQNKYQIQF